MIACCNYNSSAPYMTEDGKLHEGFLEKHYPPGTKLVKIQDSTSTWAKRRFKQSGEFPAPEKAVDPDGNIHDICLCNCHCVGSSMMH